MDNNEKIRVFTQYMRRLWPKYDKDLDQLITGKEYII